MNEVICMVVRMLPVIEQDGSKYFFDERMRQLRNVTNPFDFVDLDEEQVERFKEQLRG